MAPTCGWPSYRGRRHAWRSPSTSPVVRRVGHPAQVVARRFAALRLGPRATGGTCIAGASGASGSIGGGARWRRRSAVRSGSSACPSTTSTMTAPSIAFAHGPKGSGLFALGRVRRRARSPSARTGLATCASRAVCSPPSPGQLHAPSALVRIDLESGGEERLRRDEHADHRPGLSLDAAAHRVPDLRRPHRLRLVLPADQPRCGRGGG